MKNFALFAGDNYYPSGGMLDLVGRFDSVEEAVAGAKAPEDDEYEWATWGRVYDWYQVVDLTTFTVVVRG